MRCAECERLRRELMEASVDSANILSDARSPRPSSPELRSSAKSKLEAAYAAYAHHLEDHEKGAKAEETAG